MITNGARLRREIKYRIVMEKIAFKMEQAFSPANCTSIKKKK
jgi:hypothetical protein